MSKHRKHLITLVSPGVMVENLHFGTINLNERDFIIEVFETTSEYGPIPGYICKCDGIQSELYQTLTVAICSVYKRIFGTETKFSGPAVMGFDTPTISNALL
ncbi:hypothetical protein Glove_63g96 [Diversispora epigaea]|uniref:Uncharacterized protein n=1 Tax=Diversispora epigaea TaxID=1348612 RepID=A0A397JKI0_9GLOM|nr:hypothetical protein Glove_63g96 [Diversispora epigaea]